MTTGRSSSSSKQLKKKKKQRRTDDTTATTTTATTTTNDKKTLLQEPSSSKTTTIHPPSKLKKEEEKPKFHIVFSTGCSDSNDHPDWQSYLFFHQAWKVQQPGDVTRVVSGCNDKEERRITQFHKDYIQTMSPQFHIHFTPDYRFVKPGLDYVYFNKAFGLKHWLDHGEGLHFSSFAHNNDDNNDDDDDVIFIVLDPDQILLRPFTTHDFTTNDDDVIWSYPESLKKKNSSSLIIQRGVPFGQQYGFSLGTKFEDWLPNVDMERVLPPNNNNHLAPSPVSTISKDDAKHHYPVGPPYIATGYDFFRLVTTWTEFAPQVADVKPGHITEMYAYVLAAAHLQLPHTMAKSFMVSNIHANKIEGWSLIDSDESLSNEDVCSSNLLQSTTNRKLLLPHTLHYCQQYMLGKTFIFSKYIFQKEFISCHAPLLTEPPKDIATLYDYGIGQDGQFVTYNVKKNKKIPKRQAFMLCQMSFVLNEAATYFKQQHCGNDANYNKMLVFHNYPKS